MGKLRLSIALDYYDHVTDLVNGRVPIAGIDPTFLQIHPPSQIFFRLLSFREFDVSEISLAKYAALRSQGDSSLIAIPVFTSRVPRHSAIYVRSGGGVSSPRDLAGRRVGVPEWSQTAIVYVRGMLQHEHGLALADIDWLQAGIDDAGRVEKVEIALPAGIRLRRVADRNLGDMLIEGEIDALVAPSPPRCFREGDARVRRLFEDYVTLEKQSVASSGVFPIMHLVALRGEVFERDPWIARSLFDAFDEAKRNSIERMRRIASHVPLPWSYEAAREAEGLLGRDFFPYGLEPNRKTLEAFLQYAWEQGVTAKRLAPEDLFAPNVLARYKR
jgi:4,5-dihydroxyphthalate decarboxylase